LPGRGFRDPAAVLIGPPAAANALEGLISGYLRCELGGTRSGRLGSASGGSRHLPSPAEGSTRRKIARSRIAIGVAGGACSARAAANRLAVMVARLVFEQKNQDVFDEHIAVVNDLLEEHAPDVALMFNAAYDRIRDPNPEALHQAGTTCRRVLKAVADILYPARAPIIDSRGRDRLVGEDQFVNRPLAYAEEHLPETMGEAWKRSLTDLAGRLDAMLALTSKGVHGPEFALFEARHAAMQRYLVVGDLLRLNEIPERTEA
jgi:hypothetical protein